jgi:2-methylisocitrate lyase-like PEP mutase family enzyme
MPTRPNDAAVFAALHKGFLILPNAWDAASAAVVERAGAKAIATSSAAVAWAHGFADGHDLPIAKLAIAVEEIARAVSVPITCDAEGGYSDDPASVAENVSALIGVGAVGINLEDGKQPHELHLKKIEAARNAAERAGVALYINARTDVFLKRLVPPEQALEETIRRGNAAKQAGASGLFAPLVINPEDIKALVAGVDLPLNLMGWAGLPDAATLKALGAKRLSAATGLFHAAALALKHSAEAFLATGDSGALAASGGERSDYNAWFKR